ncbi:MAG TPA: tetratricopeptide repeat protein [Chroococcidiopsis sp.]
MRSLILLHAALAIASFSSALLVRIDGNWLGFGGSSARAQMPLFSKVDAVAASGVAPVERAVERAIVPSSFTKQEPDTADLLLMQGIERLQVSQLPAALDLFQQAVARYQSPEFRRVSPRASALGAAEALGYIGQIYRTLGDYPQALAAYQQVLQIRQTVGDRTGEGEALNDIAVVYLFLGDDAQALNYSQQALDRFAAGSHP